MTDRFVHIDEAILILNEIHEADPTVLPALIGYRVPCNEILAEHPTVQVGGEIDHAEVGLLGILNGIFGIRQGSQGGYIGASYDDDHVLTHFVNMELEALAKRLLADEGGMVSDE